MLLVNVERCCDACMAPPPALESLVNTLVPQSNLDEELARRLVRRCQEILSRHAPSLFLYYACFDRLKPF